MKRFCILLILLFLCSCSEFFDERQSLSLSEKGEFVTKTVLKTSSSKVTQDEVIDYLSFREGIVADGIKSITRYDLSPQSYIYIVNLAKGGWLLVSGDKFCTPILAQSDTGELHFGEKLSRHDAGWIESIKEYINTNKNESSEDAIKSRNLWNHSLHMARMKDRFRSEEPDTSDVPIEFDYTYEWDTVVNLTIPPLTVTAWDQTEPYNGAIPYESGNVRCAAGCTVIAIAQLLYYTHYTFGVPSQMYENAICNNYYYDRPYTFVFSNPTTTSWDYMPLTWEDSYNQSNNYVAALCAAVSYISNTTYGVDISGSYGNTINLFIPYTLAMFQLLGASEHTTFSKSEIVSELNAGRPVLTSGFQNMSSQIGHSFIIEGYRWLRVKETETVRDLNGNLLEQNVLYIDDTKEYINTGEMSHIFTNTWTYYCYNRSIYIGWGQNW